MVLDEEAAARLVPVGRQTAQRLRLRRHLRALATDVHDPAARLVPALDAGAMHLQAVVGFLEVEEVALVHEPDLLERRTAHHHRRTTDPVDPFGLRTDRAAHAPPTQQPGDRAEGETALDLGEQSGKPEHDRPRRAVGLVDATAADADARMRDQEVDQRSQRAGRRHGVGIQQPEEVRGSSGGQGPPDREVVAVGEAAVVRRRQQLDPVRPALALDRRRQHRHRVIPGGVVDHDHARPGLGLHLGGERAQAIDDQPRRAVVDDDDLHRGPGIAHVDPAPSPHGRRRGRLPAAGGSAPGPVATTRAIGEWWLMLDWRRRMARPDPIGIVPPTAAAGPDRTATPSATVPRQRIGGRTGDLGLPTPALQTDCRPVRGRLSA